MIITICGYDVQIDDEDIVRVESIDWHVLKTKNLIYFARHIFNGGKDKTILLHRFLLDAPDGMKVDHKDRNTFNNKKENLRLCTHAENMRNCKKNTKNTSGYKGVTCHSNCKKKKWHARIKVNKKRISLGYFVTPEEAHKAYCEASKKYHGEFGRTM
jgi:hypothetical protein